ncbi:DNA methyltransferase [Sesbania bispinosa]|nr:DNA methyltransferase [Sesbania bispinosa]
MNRWIVVLKTNSQQDGSRRRRTGSDDEDGQCLIGLVVTAFVLISRWHQHLPSLTVASLSSLWWWVVASR